MGDNIDPKIFLNEKGARMQILLAFMETYRAAPVYSHQAL